MKNKLTQIEKNMIETQKKMIDAFEKSGVGDMLRSRHKAHLEEINKASKIPPIIPIKNLTPTDKRIRKAEELLYEFTFNKKNADVEDVLKALEIVGKSRVKAKTKRAISDGSGESYKYRKKCLKVYERYIQLQAQGKSKPDAKKMIRRMKKYGKPAPTTLKGWLIQGKKEEKKKPLYSSNK